MKKILLTFFCFLFLLTMQITTPINAAEKNYFSNGMDISDIIFEENNPLLLQSKELIFNISDLPMNNDNYTSHLIENYSFYNPTSQVIKTSFLLSLPYNSYNQNENIDQFLIQINQENVDKTLHHTLNRYFYDIIHQKEYINENIIQNEFFNLNTKIYKYTYKITKFFKKGMVMFEINHDFFKDNNLILTNYDFHDKNSKIEKIGYNTQFNKEIEIYFIGQDIDSLQFNFYDSKDKKTSGSIDFIAKNEFSLQDMINQFYDQNSQISLLDWANGMIQKLIDYQDIHIVYMYNNSNFFDLSEEFSRWYKVSLNVQPFATCMIQTIAPIYPGVNKNYEPYLYQYHYHQINYNYQTSPFVTIQIHTSMYIQNDSSFKKAEDGYFITLDNLDNFTFTLASAKEAKMIKDGLTFWIVLMIIIVSAFIALILFPIIKLLIDILKCNKISHPYLLCLENQEERDEILKDYNRILKKKKMTYLCILFIYISFCLFLLTEFLYLENYILSLIVLFAYFILIMFNHYNFVFILWNAISILFGFISLFTLPHLVYIMILMSFISILYLRYIIMRKQNQLLNEIICKAKDQKENDSLDSSPTLKYLPKGFLTLKSFICFVLVVSLCFSLGIILWVVSESFLLFILGCLFTIIIAFISALVIQLMNTSDYRRFNKDLNLNQYKESLTTKLSNPKIDPEYKNFLLCHYCNALLFFNFDEFLKLKESLFRPITPSYQFVYDGLQLHCLLSYEDFIEQFNYLITIYHRLVPQLENFKKYWMPYYLNVQIDDIDKKYPYNTKYESKNVCNLFIQIFYYRHQNNSHKENELIALFYQKYSSCTTFIHLIENR